MEIIDSLVEVPFHFRHQCWFCNEPSGHYFSFPQQPQSKLVCIHPKLTVPACQECLLFAKNADKPKPNVAEYFQQHTAYDSIWQVRQQVKKALYKKYQKDLVIGLNWTEQELKESQFEGGNFESFQKSAWFMYQIAKQRLGFKGWKLVFAGSVIEELMELESFSFDGVEYPSIHEAVEHYCQCFDLHKPFFNQVLAIMGSERFADAVRYCRLYVGATPQERSVAIKLLKAG